MPSFLLTATAAVVAGCTMFDSFASKVPPRSSTHGTIWVMKQRILRYARLHNCLPKSLGDLPEIPGKIDRVQDAWGRDIIMSFADGKGTLTSLGRDGKPGGTGDDADMTGVFPLKNEKGEWADDDVEWIQEPQL
jgi:hypothetical protein